MECTEQKKRVLIYIAIKLMNETGIEIRDTWTDFENESFEVQKTPGDEACFFIADKEPADGYKSLVYNNPIIVLSEQYGGAAHPVVHEAVHYLQHYDQEMEDAYFKTRQYTQEGFREFASQREETEAYFIQMLFIARHEYHLVKPRELKQFRNRIYKAISRPAMRISAICWAVRSNVFIKQNIAI